MEEYVYLAYDGQYCKIGRSTNPEKRIKDLQTANPSLKLLGYGNFTTETHVHNLFNYYRVSGEFFRLTKEQREKLLQFLKGEINSLDNKWIKKMRAKSSNHKKMKSTNNKSKKIKWTVPFGKYKGYKLGDVNDVDYCAWVIQNVGNKAIVNKFKYRFEQLRNK